MAIRADYINSGPNLKEISDLFSMFAYNLSITGKNSLFIP